MRQVLKSIIAGLIPLLALVFFWTPSTGAEFPPETPPDVKLLLLSSDKAVMEIGGKTRRLRVGEASPEGLRLLAIGSGEATILYAGQEKVIRQARSYGAGPAAPAERLHRVYADARGMYHTSGFINGQPVNFVVDTGATTVALSSRDADRLGIDYRRHGKRGYATTASSVVNIHVVRLSRIKVGEITQYSVEASVIEGDFPRVPLLGMSFLKNLEMQRESHILILRQLN